MNTSLVNSRDIELINTIDGNVREIELTPSQFQQMETAYNTVTNWLATSNNPYLEDAELYPQGSVRLRTTVKPLMNDNFDLDFICFLPSTSTNYQSADDIYDIVGDRLAEHKIYRDMLEPMNRCWRINYAKNSNFHMDITPAMPNPFCTLNGILVPDKERKELKPSNPKKYAEIFDNISLLMPVFTVFDSIQFSEALNRASVEPLPNPMKPKDILRRIVQISKRHRDIFFQEKNDSPPISIIITTLLMESYKFSARNTYQNPWDFIIDVIAKMPTFILKDISGYNVPNPSAIEENFAEKWNKHPERAKSFYEWHKQFYLDMSELAKSEGIDTIQPLLEKHIIGPESQKWHQKLIDSIGQKRTTYELTRLSGMGGLSTSQTGIRVPKNTFFGD